MALRLRHVIIPSFLALCALPPLAQADIGKVGRTGPVKVVNPEPPPRYVAPRRPDMNMPLLVIRFNRHHVYYERALMEAVDSTKQVKPGASYHVISSIPAGTSPSQTARLSQEAQANLQEVVQQLEKNGVPDSQIHFETTSAEPGSPQEIQVFVK